ncbi:MAG: prepilin peptidase [Alphaproteobacteria bacterium]|nr:prepilin peptidase [Alphaproteobacteria bacterium]MCB9691456.1 prepilin peptidase [Alphaproteobacteria bacterium]
MVALYTLYQGVAFVFGLVIGSFWNVCIARWPEDRSVVAPRSACPACGTPIAAWDNVPVLSWLVLGGRCRACGAPIAPTYPLVELLGGLLAFLAWRRFVPTPADLDVAHVAAALVYFVFVSALVVGAFIDIRHRILPDQVTLAMVPVGLAAGVLLPALGYVGWLDIGWRGAALGALLGGGFFGSAALLGRVFTGVEALGWGDVRLVTAIGAFLGPPGVMVVTFWGTFVQAFLGIVATIVAQRRVYLPFGPTLAAGALAYVYYGDVLVAAWLPMFARAWTP